jgi:beta-lactamase regulating signal transducer with metallopeptidase domain
MISDLLHALLKVNLAAGAGILLVLMLRRPIRRMFGATAAYALWLVVPLAAGASLLPALRTVPVAADAHLDLRALIEQAPVAAGVLTVLWMAGVAVMLAVLATTQRRFMRKAAKGQAGPAIVGVLDPRLVLPADFADRFDEQEQALIRAHERVHLERDDPRANAVLALMQCLFWFNPLVHVAATRVRLDQELSCDAVVIARYPKERRRYAEAMLKTQLAEQALPVGCYWPSRGRHPLEARIALLKAPAPTTGRQLAGLGLIAALALVSVAAAWSAQPPRTQQPPPPSFQKPVMNILILR